MAGGWVIEVITKNMSGGGETSECFVVGEDNQAKAVETVKMAIGATSDERVEARAPLDQKVLDAMGIKSGKVATVTMLP
jgi:hypothetical protein